MKYYSAKEAAVYLGKSERTIRQWIKTGKLKAKKQGHLYRISKRSLDIISGSGDKKASAQTGRKSGSSVASKELKENEEIPKQDNDIAEHIAEIYEYIKQEKNLPVLPVSMENPLVEELRRQLDTSKEEAEKIRQESMRLANLLGQAQNEVKQLQEKVKMLEVPKEEKKPKRRWFWRRKDYRS